MGRWARVMSVVTGRDGVATGRGGLLDATWKPCGQDCLCRRVVGRFVACADLAPVVARGPRAVRTLVSQRRVRSDPSSGSGCWRHGSAHVARRCVGTRRRALDAILVARAAPMQQTWCSTRGADAWCSSADMEIAATFPTPGSMMEFGGCDGRQRRRRLRVAVMPWSMTRGADVSSCSAVALSPRSSGTPGSMTGRTGGSVPRLRLDLGRGTVTNSRTIRVEVASCCSMGLATAARRTRGSTTGRDGSR